ncbi:DUF262 domain-containing protein [Granulicoccus phenolivorans]|uniref:DUF262 domain-containing protein n=1 Tax=Granulicoccus phenolivorans TaxID=266854 RepID=UPI0004799F79|nr:DUF262 domain-containing protein [Granulicoccus phenolivorans]
MDNLISWAKPEQFGIDELRNLALRGRIRVPEFQRSFRWASSDVLDLFDSLLRGFPIGSLLLWQAEAPSGSVQLGALSIEAPESSDAYWVIDGQQRITSLVNAVSPEAFDLEDRFRLMYSLEDNRIKRPHEARGELAIPLPDLFDMPRAMGWVSDKGATDQVARIAEVNQFLRDIRIPASVVARDADMTTLREIFDRMNSSGKRLRGAEIFDAINRSLGNNSADTDSTAVVADRVAAATTFGRVSDDVVHQAILVRRHPDFARDPHGEFGSERQQISNFPDEDQTQAYRGAEEALIRAVSFLTDTAGVPHTTFLPYRSLLLVLVRFMAFHPRPSPRNRELLSRWFWRAAVAFATNTISNTQQTGRMLAGQIEVGDEDATVQHLLTAVSSADGKTPPGAEDFKAPSAVSKIHLCAYWALQPIEPSNGIPIDGAALATALEDSPTASPVLPKLSPRPPSMHLAARIMSLNLGGAEAVQALATKSLSVPDDRALRSHLFEFDELPALQAGDLAEILPKRAARFDAHIEDFIAQRTAWGFESTPPLSLFDLDDEATEAS